MVLSYLLARDGYDVLVVDLDPQSSLTLALGYDPDELDRTLVVLFSAYSSKKGDVSPGDVVRSVEFLDASFDFMPSTPLLEEFNFHLGAAVGGERVFAKILNDSNDYDVVVIDTQPSLSKLLVNALVAADRVLTPVELSYLSIGGLTLLVDTVVGVRDAYNEDLEWLGILPTKFEKRSVSARKNLEKLRMLEGRIKIYDPVPKSAALERLLIERLPVEEVVKRLKSAREVLAAYGKVVEDVKGLLG
jgi:chromosome partitioning protein